MSCFICFSKLSGERVQVCSNRTLHTKTPYAEKICALMGEEIVVIVTPLDHMCLKCTSNLNHLDKLHSDAKIVEDVLVSCIRKSYGILPSTEDDESDEGVNGDSITTEEQPQQGQLKVVPHSLPTGVAHTATTDSVTPISTPLKMVKIQPQPLLQQPRQLQPRLQQPRLQQPRLQQLRQFQPRQLQPRQLQPRLQQPRQPKPPLQQPRQQPPITERLKIYKCAFCAFQSKDLPHVRFHMRSHKEKDKSDNPSGDEAAAATLATMATLTPIPQKKRLLYRCQVCSKNFDSRINCLDHIQKDHNPPTPSTSSEPREDSHVTTQSMMPGPSKIKENNQQAETPVNVNENQQSKDDGTVDTDKMLNDNVPTEELEDVKDEKKSENGGDKEETKNSQEGANLENEPKPIKEEEAEAGGEKEAKTGGEEDAKDTAVPEQVDCDTSDGNVEKIKNGELDIESMLAALHSDTPPSKIRRSKRKAS